MKPVCKAQHFFPDSSSGLQAARSCSPGRPRLRLDQLFSGVWLPEMPPEPPEPRESEQPPAAEPASDAGSEEADLPGPARSASSLDTRGSVPASGAFHLVLAAVLADVQAGAGHAAILNGCVMVSDSQLRTCSKHCH